MGGSLWEADGVSRGGVCRRGRRPGSVLAGAEYQSRRGLTDLRVSRRAGDGYAFFFGFFSYGTTSKPAFCHAAKPPSRWAARSRPIRVAIWQARPERQPIAQ